jgi:hypothetical protein
VNSFSLTQKTSTEKREDDSGKISSDLPESRSSDNKTKSSIGGYIAIGFVALIVISLYGLQSNYASIFGPISRGMIATFAGVATVLAFVNCRRFGFKLSEGFSRTWIWLAIGMLSWFVGETLWVIYNVFLNIQVPYPSIIDLFYLFAYIPLSLGLFNYFSIFSAGLPKKRLTYAIIALVIALSVVALILFPPVIADKHPALQKAFDIAYPLMDLFLLSGAILGFSIFKGGTIERAWLLIIAGVFLFIAGDILFAFQTGNGTYYNGSIDDMMYVLGYLTFAGSFYAHKKEF